MDRYSITTITIATAERVFGMNQVIDTTAVGAADTMTTSRLKPGSTVTGLSITTIATIDTATGIQATTPTTKGAFGCPTIEVADTIVARGMTIATTEVATATDAADIKRNETSNPLGFGQEACFAPGSNQR